MSTLISPCANHNITFALAFEDCARGKTVSIVWYCREVKDKMYECLRAK